MKLCAVEIAPLHAGAEGIAVAAARDRGGTQGQRIAVHEVRVVARRRCPRAGRTAARMLEVFQPMCGTGRSAARREARCAARNDAETVRACLPPMLRYSNCIPRQTPSTGCRSERITVSNPCSTQSRHRVRRGADSGENDVARRANCFRVRGHRRRGAEPLQGKLQRGDVGAAAGDDHDFSKLGGRGTHIFAHRAPLVLGRSRPSSRMA